MGACFSHYSRTGEARKKDSSGGPSSPNETIDVQELNATVKYLSVAIPKLIDQLDAHGRRQDEALSSLTKHQRAFGDRIKQIAQDNQALRAETRKLLDIQQHTTKMCLVIHNDIVNTRKELSEVSTQVNLLSQGQRYGFSTDFDRGGSMEYGQSMSDDIEGAPTTGISTAIISPSSPRRDELLVEFFSTSSISEAYRDSLKSILLDWLGPLVVRERLYDSQTNGPSGAVFHRNCDRRGSTLVILETPEGDVFGGVTHRSWESPKGGRNKLDRRDFVFRLVNRKAEPPKVWKWKKGIRSMQCDGDYGPIIGGSDTDLVVLGSGKEGWSATAADNYPGFIDTRMEEYPFTGEYAFKIKRYRAYSLASMVPRRRRQTE